MVQDAFWATQAHGSVDSVLAMVSLFDFNVQLLRDHLLVTGSKIQIIFKLLVLSYMKD